MYFLRGSKRYFAAAMVSSCVLAALELINPRVIGITVDSVIGEEPFDLPLAVRSMIDRIGGRDYLRSHLYVIALFVVCCAFLNGISRILYRTGATKGAETLLRTMRNDLYTHIIRLPFSWHAAHQTGDIIQRCTSDVETIKKFISEQFVVLLRMLVWIVFSVIFMWRIHTGLTVIVLFFLPVIITNSLIFHKHIAARFRVSDEEEGRLSAIAQENLTGVRVVRAFGKERYERKRFETQSGRLHAADIRLGQLFVTFWSVSSFLSRFQMFLILLIGAVFCVRGSLTSGHYLEFIGYNAMISWPVRMLGRIISEMSKAGVSIERIRYIMNAGEESALYGEDEDFPAGDITFSHVSFSFTGEGRVLDDVSFTVRQGETLGILGATGSGKSTLMYLMTRLYDLDDDAQKTDEKNMAGQPLRSGIITVGGKDIRQIPRHAVRRRIGMVLQEPYLFSRTLEENLTIAKRDADKKTIRNAVKTAALKETIDHFTHGYDTLVGERGVTLSGGQKQRTAIAQMLIREPDIMIFDDSLSAVDAETDLQIRNALLENAGRATVILISHRLTTLMHADHIIVLDKGRIAEEGTHETLLKRQGIYHRIYELQTAGASE